MLFHPLPFQKIIFFYMIPVGKYKLIYMCMHRNTPAFALKHCIWTALKSFTLLHYKI